jgi:pilus assembly protein CpaE
MNGKVVTFIKGSGGVGATSVAVQTACAVRNAKLALLDLDIQFGSAAFQMDVKSSTSVVDLIASPDRMDDAMLKGAMVRPHDRFDLLAAPEGVHPMDDVTAEGVFRVMEVARSAYDTTLIDLPMTWAEWSHFVLSKSDHVVLVTRLTIPTLRQTRRQLDMIKQENLGDIPLFVVANHFESYFLRKDLSKQDGENVLGRSIDFVLPEDAAMIVASSAGLPLSEVRGGGSLTKKLSHMMTMILSNKPARLAA